MKHILGGSLLFLFASADASLIDRGGGFIYDGVLDITWTQNANINGQRSWANQVAWADSLSLFDSVRKVTWDDWRLPTTLQLDASCDFQFIPGGGFALQGMGFGCTGSEMGHLANVDGISPTSMGLFTNVQVNDYWSGTLYEPNLNDTWFFGFDGGYQYNVSKFSSPFYAWAVRDGDVAAGSCSSRAPCNLAIWFSPRIDRLDAAKDNLELGFDGGFLTRLYARFLFECHERKRMTQFGRFLSFSNKH